MGESQSIDSSRVEHERRASVNTRLPLPIAFGGIGLVLAWAIPGGISGGLGFLIGLGVGGLVLIASSRMERMPRAEGTDTLIQEHACPHCETCLLYTSDAADER